MTNTRRRNRRIAPRRAGAVSEPLLPVLLGITGLIAACANDPAEIGDPRTNQQASYCADNQTLSCVEKLGKTVSCTCSSRDDLRRILEPDRH
ncbi:MAG: hypothetical protein OEV10_09720 [Gammaproteobacteria bacterium]|nr:hypothetical protein [Gammaproteobacteria bacterium]